MWSQGLPFWSNPVNNCTFHTLCVISIGPIYAFLNLALRSAGTINWSMTRKHTKLAIVMTSSSEDSISHASSPGTIFKSSQNTTSSFHSLESKIFVTGWVLSNCNTYADESISALSSPMWMIPLVSRVWKLQKVWTAWPKWWLRWTKGSCIDLNTNQIMCDDIKEILTVSFMVQAPKHLDWHASEHLAIRKWRSQSRHCLPWRIERHDCREDVKLMDHQGKEVYLYLGHGPWHAIRERGKKSSFQKVVKKLGLFFSKLAN